jgi:hypothetical protein
VLVNTVIDLFVKFVEIALIHRSLLLNDFGHFFLNCGVEVSFTGHIDVVPVAELINKEFGELISSVLLIALAAGGLGLRVHFLVSYL